MSLTNQGNSIQGVQDKDALHDDPRNRKEYDVFENQEL